MIGTQILHYRIERRIGAGGMGEVYLATDTNLDRQVALKFLPESLSRNAEARERLIREARAASKLDHPNIVTIHGVERADDRDFIVMSYVDGDPLMDYSSGRELTLEGIIDLAIGMATGMAEAHAAGIVHRDLKPANVLVDRHGRPRILDFGLAKLEGETKLTRTGSTVGTMAYMSPEQAMSQEVDHRSDLFSLGVILYEMVGGRRPFAGEEGAAVLYAIANETPEPLARYKANLPDELHRVVTKCLAKHPEERYQSAADLITDLKHVKRLLTGDVALRALAPASRRRSVRTAFATVLSIALVTVTVALIWNPFASSPENSARAARTMLVVLPFENLGSAEQEYFADGMTEEITSRLASIASLGVISRTSAMHYKGTDKTLRVIGEELGVDYVLEGTVRWDRVNDTDYVRITPQLIHVGDDTHMWADRIERPLTRVFSVQADIAERVVQSLNLALREPEQQSLARISTENLQAYDYYLRGLDIWINTFEEDKILQAQEMFERAVALDSQFVPAWVRLTQTHAFIPFCGWTDGPRHLLLAKNAAEHALRLAPDLPESHMAMGYYYYWGHRDYESALREFAIAEQGLPNSSDLLMSIGFVKRRQGKWEEAYDRIKRGFELDPTAFLSCMELGFTCNMMRRFEEGWGILERGMSLYPRQVYLYELSIWNTMGRTADPAALQQIIDRIPPDYSGTRERRLRAYVAHLTGDTAAVIDFSHQALQFSTTATDSAECYASLGQYYQDVGQQTASEKCFDSALVIIQGLPEDVTGRLEFVSGIYFGLGHKQEAIRLARAYSDALSLAHDAAEGVLRKYSLAVIYSRAGEVDLSLDILETLFSIPSNVNVNMLRISPTWVSLRDNPRFQALLKKGDQVV